MAFSDITRKMVTNGFAILAVIVFIGFMLGLLATYGTSGMTSVKSREFTSASTSGSADPLSEGIGSMASFLPSKGPNWIRPGAPAMDTGYNKIVSVGKPLVDLSVAPMKREIPGIVMARARVTHRGR